MDDVQQAVRPQTFTLTLPDAAYGRWLVAALKVAGLNPGMNSHDMQMVAEVMRIVEQAMMNQQVATAIAVGD